MKQERVDGLVDSVKNIGLFLCGIIKLNFFFNGKCKRQIGDRFRIKCKNQIYMIYRLMFILENVIGYFCDLEVGKIFLNNVFF